MQYFRIQIVDLLEFSTGDWWIRITISGISGYPDILISGYPDIRILEGQIGGLGVEGSRGSRVRLIGSE
jgi:hypothetical protein